MTPAQVAALRLGEQPEVTWSPSRDRVEVRVAGALALLVERAPGTGRWHDAAASTSELYYYASTVVYERLLLLTGSWHLAHAATRRVMAEKEDMW